MTLLVSGRKTSLAVDKQVRASELIDFGIKIALYRYDSLDRFTTADRTDATRPDDVISPTSGNVNHIQYDAYGNVQSQTNAAYGRRMMYTGRELDSETGLYSYSEY